MFSKVVSNIKKLSNKRIYFNSVINENNIDNLDLFYIYANEIGIEEVTFQFPMWYENLKEFYKKYNFDYYAGLQEYYDLSYMKKLGPEIKKIQSHKNFNTRYRFYPEIFTNNIEEYIDGTIRDKAEIICTDMLEPKLKILPNGDIVLCEAFKTKIGNICNDNVLKIWNGEVAISIRKSIFNNNLTELCVRCCSINCSSRSIK